MIGVLLLLAAVAGCGASSTDGSGRQGGGLDGTGTRDTQFRVAGNRAELDLSLRLLSGSVRLELIDPSFASTEVLTATGPENLDSELSAIGPPGWWTARWHYTGSAGSYELRWPNP